MTDSASDPASGPDAAPVPALADLRVAVIGLGYVGLPLALAFGALRPTLGFDISAARVAALQAGKDATGEADADALAAATHLRLSADPGDLAACNVYIVAVPTPIDAHHQPDLGPLLAASRMIGGVIGRGDIVIYESTVYPGATEEDCLPEVERVSGLVFGRDFHAGYSPERINPGDRSRPLSQIVKVTSGSSPEVAELVDALYRSVIAAGTHKAPSIRVAEAAKVIENVQRDVNIALINELSIVFAHLGLDSAEVLDAAATKWNFNRLSPGLVGGHCIGVDPFYLLHKSAEAGYIPDIIRLSRQINDGMAEIAAGRLVRAMIGRGQRIKGARVLILGLAFKENCPDLRNTKVVDLVRCLQGYGISVDVHDPHVDPAAARTETGLDPIGALPGPGAEYQAVVLAVPHAGLVDQGPARLTAGLASDGVFFDLKSVFGRDQSDLRL